MTALPSRPPPKPWPMKWVVAAILVFVVGYTFLNLRYRKPGKPHEPYAELLSRATAAKLQAAGWERIPVDARRPAEKTTADTATAVVGRGGPGLGAELTEIFAERPRLLGTIDRVIAPTVVRHGEQYSAYFAASLSDLHGQLADLALYRKGNTLVLIAGVEPLPGRDLRSRWNDSSYWFGFPTQSLPPGRYHVRLVAAGPAATWSFELR
jgi:hypothetical protein